MSSYFHGSNQDSTGLLIPFVEVDFGFLGTTNSFVFGTTITTNAFPVTT